MMDAVSGKEITALDLGPKFLEHFGYPYIVMHRGDLLTAELDACRASRQITLEANKEVVGVEDLGDGCPRYMFRWFSLRMRRAGGRRRFVVQNSQA